MPLRACEHGAGFVDGEGVVVAEGVAVLGETEFGHFGDEFFGDEADVVGTAVFVFGRDGVGGEQRRDDASWAFFVESANHAKHFEFGVAVEAVAGFGFDAWWCPSGASSRDGGGRRRVIHLRGGAGESYGAQDASAGCSDLLVGGAGDALFEFGGAVSGEDEVGVGVDEAGGYAAACGVDVRLSVVESEI